MHIKEAIYIVNIDDEVLTKWTANNKQWYVDRGYEYTGQWTELWVKIKDLSEGSRVKIPAICDYCGGVKWVMRGSFKTRAEEFPNYCCNKCKGKKIPVTTYQQRQDAEWKKLSIACNEKGYKVITNKDSYTTTKMYIDYICPKHGLQRSQMNNMIAGHGCARCAYETNNDKTRHKPDDVEKIINSKNGNKLLNKDEYKSIFESNLRVQCACGNVYTVSLRNYNYGQIMCINCSNKQSYNERRIRNFLETEGIDFEAEKTFPGLKDKSSLRFDFYLSKYNLVIEYDGEGHYLDSFYRNFSDDPHNMLLNAQRKDKIKNKYCEENGINLLRIPYWEAENIEAIISQKLEELKCAA